MLITDVRIRLRIDGPLRAFASITFDNAFVVHGIKIFEERDGLVVTMPSRVRSDGSIDAVVHSTSAALQKSLESMVLRAYREARRDEDGAGWHAPLDPEPPRRGGTAARDLRPYSEPDSTREDDDGPDRPPAHP